MFQTLTRPRGFFLRREHVAMTTALVTLMGYGHAQAQTLDEVVVSASRIEQRAFDTAASVNVINTAQIQEGQAQANLSESLVRVPGIFAFNRQNYAQDLLISSRGFGANSAFGTRGIKLFVDGIPGTVADGQGQISHIDLASTERIEVLRGPFSVLYGNSAGGVISVFTEKGKPGIQVTPYAEVGSHKLKKYGVKVAGEQGKVNYVLDAGKLETDGYRQHSTAERENENAKLSLQLSPDTALQMVLNRVALNAQDPAGLTAAQVQQDPTQAGGFTELYNTRKTVEQTQAGLVLDHRVNASNSVVVSSYYGERKTVQFLPGNAFSVNTTQANGVIDLGRDFYGMDLKWLHSNQLNGMPLRLVGGIDRNQNDDRRLTYGNKAGIQAALTPTQDLDQSARNLDGYLQAELRPNERLTLSAGARHSRTTLNSIKNNTNVASPGSGSHTYEAWTSLLSAQYYVRDDTNVYASFGTGFDTPTLNQTAYSADYLNCTVNCVNDGNMGLNAATTRQLEVGVKSEIAGLGRIALAVFTTTTRDDIVVDASVNGRTSYTNVPKTSRTGLELGATLPLSKNFQANVSYTWLDAKVEQGYTTASNKLIDAGNRIPGVPNQGLYTELMWNPAGKAFEFAVEGRLVGRMAATDDNSAFANGYGLMNLRAIARQQLGKWALTEFVRVDNLFDRAHVGSVIVNQSRQQYFEPAPGRNWILGAKATLAF